MKEWMQQWMTSIEVNYQWVIQIFVIVFLTLLTNFLWRRYYLNIKDKLNKTKNLWDDALWESIHKPMGYIIWIYGISFAAEITSDVAETDITVRLSNIRHQFVFRFG